MYPINLSAIRFPSWDISDQSESEHRSFSVLSFSAASVRPVSRKSAHFDTAALKLPKIREANWEFEQRETTLQFLDQYYHLISQRSKSSLSKTAKLTWKDTDSDLESTVIPLVNKCHSQSSKVDSQKHSSV
ncbi:uncharacterized protein LOC144618652 [Crassostrea virginica]